jgi:CelD/BcsL family acetyltransferase involved in cellulose biosynthesis
MEERLSLDEIEACATDFDRCVDAEPDVDRFCSRSEWILPYQRAFLPERELFVYRGGRDGRSFAALAAREHESVGLYLEPIENMWCFACPLIGPESVELLEAAIADVSMLQSPEHEGVAMALSGIPESRSPEGLLARLVQHLDDRYELRAVDSTLRFVASLDGGLDGWLSRRSRSFRKSLRQAQKKAEDEPLQFQHLEITSATDARDLYPRILSIESQSWKSAAGNGVDQGHMRRFYEDMLPRVAARGGLRVLIVTCDGHDAGYLHGALTGDHFRGLQLSYDQRFEHLSLGNLMQREMIERLCDEGARSYDLGTRSDYKRRWAEDGPRTLTLVARPR